jgi:hypothetical protein
MRTRTSLSSAPGHLLQVAAGLARVWFGATDETFVGLVMMMIGLPPLVSGAAALWLAPNSTG